MKKLLKTTMKIVISFILLIAISITGSYVVNTYAAERTVVDGHSMDDNFYDGENVIANKIIYNFRSQSVLMLSRYIRMDTNIRKILLSLHRDLRHSYQRW